MPKPDNTAQGQSNSNRPFGEQLDRQFDQLAEHFADKIYNSPKGQIRLALLQRDLQAIQQQTPLRVLDAGGGQGHISRWFAQAGHRITLCDSSAEMLEKARLLNQQAGLEQQIEIYHGSIEQFCQSNQDAFDLILCHAVLEWSQHPRQLIEQLNQHLNAAGRLSLMFYNQHSLILRNALRGNLRKVKRGDWRGDGNGLTPYQPLDPDQVYDWLQQCSLTVDSRSGIRCFYDYLPANVRKDYAFEDILELEIDHYRQQPYIHMARYIHLLCTRNS